MKKKTKKKAGPPTKYTLEKQEAICATIRMGMGQDEAANVNDINRDTLRIWLKKYPALNVAVLKAKEQFEQDNLAIVREAAMNRYDKETGALVRKGQWTAAAWLLERRLHQKYGMRWSGEVSGKGGKPLVPDNGPKADLSRFSYDDLKRLVHTTDAMIKAATIVKSDTNGNGHTNGNGAA